MALCPDPQPLGKLLQSTDPLARVHCIGESIDSAIRGSEVGVGAKHGIIKKTGASVVGSDAPVGDKGLDKLSMYPAARIVYDLLNVKLILRHGETPFVVYPQKQTGKNNA